MENSFLNALFGLTVYCFLLRTNLESGKLAKPGAKFFLRLTILPSETLPLPILIP